MKKSYIKIIVAIEIIGVLVQAMAFYDTYGRDMTEVKRPGALEDAEDVSLSVDGLGHEGEVDISVLSIRPTDEEVDELFSRAEAEIDQSFIGENTSIDQVWRRVDIKSSYADDLVECKWDFTPRGIVDAAGNIDYEKFSESEIVTASCTMEAYDRSQEYSFPFIVVKPDTGTQEGFLYAIEHELSLKNEDNTKESLSLPEELSGERITWHRPIEYTGLLLCVIGIVTGIALYIGTGIDEKKAVEKTREEYGRQYPDIVENLSLYVGAGISVRSAFEKMEQQYLRWKDKHNGMTKGAYENLILMNRAIHDGRLEAEAYDAFGRACKHQAYRKLAILLRQNLKRGNEKLLEQLAHEEQLVADTRRREIKSAGEIISTKLLLPMGGLLLMILIVLIFPAMQSITL